MKKFINRWVVLMMSLFAFVLNAAAQTNDQPEMADAMRSNGKIYVVVAVCLLILFGLIAYVIRIDRKLSKLEQQKD
ncbi:MAG: CcmD family protein [Chitinophagaceae bacterium]|nr:CcmD family protein [Chitinophagaceae bacterium]